MTKDELPKEFADFLEQENCLEQYLENTTASASELFALSEYNYLYSAFLWNKAKEGPDYWIQINEKWISKFI